MTMFLIHLVVYGSFVGYLTFGFWELARMVTARCIKWHLMKHFEKIDVKTFALKRCTIMEAIE